MRSRVVVALTACLAAITVSAVAATPGQSQPPSGDPLLPFSSDSGLISLSVDASGTSAAAGGPIQVHKNDAGATVRRAFLFAASTGFSGYTPVDGDVTLDGSPVAWDPAHTITNDIGSVNVAANVTSLVQSKVDAAPAGNVEFTIAEPTHAGSLDGEILAVILNDPTVTKPGSVSLLYGAQQPAGDTFNVGLAEPIDLSNPDFGLNLALGISFGFQPAGQFSTVDVNGTRMTSSAGGQDDCVQKYQASPSFGSCGNGTLITAGGIGDSNDNPSDPNANDGTCSGPAGPAPRCDDELYNLLPFVNNGDSALTFTTTNPSSDDNIFFGALETLAGAAVVGKGVVLSPTTATNNVGQPHTLTAKVQDNAGAAIPDVTVHFQVTSGPNAGTSGDAVTGADGKAQFTYTSTTTGTDHIVASFTDQDGTFTSNEATKEWTGTQAGPNPTPQARHIHFSLRFQYVDKHGKAFVKSTVFCHSPGCALSGDGKLKILPYGGSQSQTFDLGAGQGVFGYAKGRKVAGKLTFPVPNAGANAVEDALNAGERGRVRANIQVAGSNSLDANANKQRFRNIKLFAGPLNGG